jgi:hypothetical protein
MVHAHGNDIKKMQKRKLGNSNLEVSAIGLGCIGPLTVSELGFGTTTQKGEPFQGHDISIDSLPALIARIAKTPGLYVRSSIGVSDN